MPTDAQELPGSFGTPEEGETPFHCLLEDDKLISKITVETDTLLEPTGENWDYNDSIVLIICII